MAEDPSSVSSPKILSVHCSALSKHARVISANGGGGALADPFLQFFDYRERVESSEFARSSGLLDWKQGLCPQPSICELLQRVG